MTSNSMTSKRKIKPASAKFFSFTLIFLLLTQNLSLATTNRLNRLSHGMSLDEVNTASGMSLKKRFIFQLEDSVYFFAPIDTERLKTLIDKTEYSLLFKDEKLIAINNASVSDSFYLRVLQCTVSRISEISPASACFRKILSDHIELFRINPQSYDFSRDKMGFYPVNWILSAGTIGLLASIDIVMVVVFSPVSFFLRNKSIRIQPPKLGDSPDLTKIDQQLIIYSPGKKNVTVPAMLVEGNKVAFGVENSRVNWIYYCNYAEEGLLC